jgi:AsmA protein
LNLDRYFPPSKKESNPNERLDLSALKGAERDRQGGNRLAHSPAGEALEREGGHQARGGKLEVSPHSASLYGGTLAGSFGRTRMAPDHDQGSDPGRADGPLLRDAIEQDRLEGRGNVNFDIAMAGPNIAALKRSMGGNARVECATAR